MSRTPCKHKNQKTEMSFDTTTRCNAERRGRPCAYCYVKMHRDYGDYLSKTYIDHEKYEGFVLRMRDSTVQKLNKVGGIRMFSFGDYLRTHRRDIHNFLDDCQLRGLRCKAITKVLRFVDDFHDYPALDVINISVDRVHTKGSNLAGSPISYEAARRYRDKYHKAVIRCVVLDDEDLKFFGSRDWVDVITLNHGQNGFKNFSHEEISIADVTYSGRVCCAMHKCAGCGTMCGIGKKKV